MEAGYNLLDEPWIPVRMQDGAVLRMGLLETMRRSHEISALAETSPPSLIAEYRLLLAVVHRGLTSAVGSWRDSNRADWHLDGLPVDAICGYLEVWRDRFWLFHPDHPFMQVAALANAEETRDKRKPWTQVSLASANGNAPVVFDHALDGFPTGIEPGEAIAHLLGFLQFTPGGLVKALRDADKAGALVNTAAVVPLGKNLAQTLCLALHPAPLPGQVQSDLPAWERPALTLTELRGEPVLASGPNDRYTRQSRAVLFDPDPDGQIRWIRFAAGLALAEDPQQPDPMASFRAGASGTVRVGFHEGRALWRDLPAIVPTPRGEGAQGYQAAAVVDWSVSLGRLMADLTPYQPLLVAGVASDQAKLLRWRLDQLVLPQALLADPQKAQELHDHVSLAEEMHRQLRGLATDLVAGTLPDPRSKDTRSRARAMVEGGPLSGTFFAAAERELGAVMALIADQQLEEADAAWHRTLAAASRLAWDRQVSLIGFSAQALRAEARLGGRLAGSIRKHLPAATQSNENYDLTGSLR